MIIEDKKVIIVSTDKITPIESLSQEKTSVMIVGLEVGM
jgi:hypothetical protein